LGLLVTMLFNTLATRQQTKQFRLATEQAKLASEQARRARQDTQVNLLTQLNALAAEAEGAVVASGVQRTTCELGDTSRAQNAAVYRAAGYFNFLAYLFNHKEIVLESARRYATPRMLDLYDLAAETFGLGYVQRTYPELRAFKFRALKTTQKPPDPCAK
jgi:hypothetical protein